MGFMERHKAHLNDLVSHSPVGRYFHLDGSGHVCSPVIYVELPSMLTIQKPKEIRGARFTTELRAGLTTFFTMAYIIAVNVSCLVAPTHGSD